MIVKTRVIDLRWALARIELIGEQGKEQLCLTIVTPEGDNGEPARSIDIWQVEGLHNLRDALAQSLDEYSEFLEKQPRQDFAQGH